VIDARRAGAAPGKLCLSRRLTRSLIDQDNLKIPVPAWMCQRSGSRRIYCFADAANLTLSIRSPGRCRKLRRACHRSRCQDMFDGWRGWLAGLKARCTPRAGTLRFLRPAITWAGRVRSTVSRVAITNRRTGRQRSPAGSTHSRRRARHKRSLGCEEVQVHGRHNGG